MEKQIKAIIERAIPLDMTCEIKRTEQLARRARLRIDIEDLLRQANGGKVGPSVIK